MKLKYLLLLLPIAIQAQIVDIPDANFKNALVNDAVAVIGGSGGLQDVDTNNDNEIQISEAFAVTELEIYNQNISSLSGIQSFENITRLLCFNNNLTQIDLSQNILIEELWVSQNDLTSLNVSGLPGLFFLSCSDNNLSGIDVSQNLNLRFLRASRNQIINIDVSANTILEQFWCSSNQLTSIDISNNPSIVNFTAIDNPLLTSLNLQNGNNINLNRMWAYDNPNLNCILVDDENATYPDCTSSTILGWCKDDSTIYAEDLTSCNLSISNFLKDDIVLYPNPVKQSFEISSLSSIKSIEIISNIGQTLMKVQTNNIDVSNFSDGIYTVLIRNADNQIISKTLIKVSH